MPPLEKEPRPISIPIRMETGCCEFGAVALSNLSSFIWGLFSLDQEGFITIITVVVVVVVFFFVVIAIIVFVTIISSSIVVTFLLRVLTLTLVHTHVHRFFAVPFIMGNHSAQ